MKKHRMRRLCLLLAVFLLACHAPAGAEEVTRVIFEEGQRLAGYSVWQDGAEIALEALPGESRMVFYLLRTCGDCIEDFEGYRLLADILGGSSLTLSFLWQTALPEAEEIALPAAQSYTVGEDLRLGDWVPTYFFTDADGLIGKKTIELDEAVAHIKDMLPAGERAALLADYLAAGKTAIWLTGDAPDDDQSALAAQIAAEQGLVLQPVAGDPNGIYAAFSSLDEGIGSALLLPLHGRLAVVTL